jgi:DNA-binding CsgD family transcriptional regulator
METEMMSPSKALLDLLDRVSCGAVLLDGEGQLVGFNASAQDCLRALSGREDTRDGNLARDLLGQIDCSEDRRRGLPMVARPIAARPDSRSNRRALSTRIWRYRWTGNGGSKPILILVDAERSNGRSAHLFRQLFALTNAEVRLATRMGDGHSLDEIAGDLAIGVETARSQLRSVFAKTRTRRQAELVALLGRVALLQAHGILGSNDLGGNRREASGSHRFSAV